VQKRRSNTRNLRLRHLLLLLLRIALIALVCLALARPRLTPDADLGILNRERPVAMVLIIDTTPSMDYKSGQETRLDLVKKRALDLIDQLPSDSRYLVLDAADPASGTREDFVASADKARQHINSLIIRPESVPVTEAIKKALDRFDAWDDPATQQLPRFVCVFTDRTTPSWDGVSLTKRVAKEDVKPAKILVFDVGIDEPTDFAILKADLPVDRNTFLQGEKIPLRVVAKATGKSVDATLQVKLAGKKVLDHAETFAAGDARTVTLTLDSNALKLEPGDHQFEIVEPTADALPFNNTRYVTVRIQEKPRVLVIADDPASVKDLVAALKAWKYAAEHKTPENASNLGDYQAIFVVSVAAPTDKLWQALKAYAADGNIAIIPGGDELQLAAYNSDAAQAVLPGKFVEPVDAKKGVVWDTLDAVSSRHSFLQPYRTWAERGSVPFIDDPPPAFRYWHIDGKDYAIVPYDDRRPAVLERRLPGKVLLLTTPLDERTPEWNDYGKSVRGYFGLALVYMCARHLCSAAEQQPLNFEFGVRPPRITKAGKVFAKYTLTAGDSADVITFDERGVWTGERLTKAGNYTIYGQNPDQPREIVMKFSVNTPGTESDLTRAPRDQIEKLLGAESVVPQDRKTPLADSLSWNEPLELFPWLMIVLLFLLALESLLANRFYRQEPAAG
jgi:hypothetical protein